MRIPFYFDYACPWAYLGSCRVESYFRDLPAEIEFRPVVLAELREGGGPAGLPPGERKRRWYLDDLRAWAEMLGAEFARELRDVRPDTRLLLRAALVALEEGRFREFHYPAFRARWAEARDVAAAEVVAELLRGAGLDPERGLARARSEEIRARLEAQTRRAVEAGVFGVPTLLVGERLFWGNDRFELAHWYARKASASS
jgi:2-hydroxychromene-2-carboxylate isomerase